MRGRWFHCYASQVTLLRWWIVELCFMSDCQWLYNEWWWRISLRSENCLSQFHHEY